MKSANEDQQLAETRRELKRLMENSTARIGPDFVWNRDEIYADRIFPRTPKPDSDGGGNKK
jgi:hypothetical protein